MGGRLPAGAEGDLHVGVNTDIPHILTHREKGEVRNLIFLNIALNCPDVH